MAGVAVSTVSAVLNDTGNAKVASSTRSRVLDAIDVLGYQPHPAARALRGKQLGYVVVIEDDISTGAYGGQMLAGVRDACDDAGVRVLSLSSRGDPAREAEAIGVARSFTQSPVILASVSETVRTVGDPAGAVLLNARSPDDDVPAVVPDNEGGSAGAARELVEFGHRRVGFVTIGPCEVADRRVEAARRVLVGAYGPGAAPDALVVRMANVEATAGGGYDAAARLLAAVDPPTAVVCFNDRMAMGVYQAAADRGLSIPRDLSVVGFDNVEPIADSLAPGLTTVALPEREMGQLAATLALGIDDSGGVPEAQPVGRTRRVPCPLVVRGSVGVPRSVGRLRPLAPGR